MSTVDEDNPHFSPSAPVAMDDDVQHVPAAPYFSPIKAENSLPSVPDGTNPIAASLPPQVRDLVEKYLAVNEVSVSSSPL